jgi:hypothetical protein
MAEKLRPRVVIAEVGLNIRRISVGSKSCLPRNTIGWADGDKNHVPSLLWQTEPILREKYGRVVKAPSLLRKTD